MVTTRVATPELILDEPARRLRDGIAADPHAPVRAGILGPGGYGKTALLAELARVYRAAGVPVVESGWESCQPGGEVLLVDDAHQLDDGRLARLRELAADERARVMVAARPWPRPAGLDGLTAALDRASLLRLLPLDRDQVAAYLRAAGSHRADTAAELLHAQTGGVPAFVERAVRALRRVAPGAALAPPDELVTAAVAEFGYELDRLDQDVLTFLIAVDAEMGMHAEPLGELLQGRLDDVVEAARATGLLGRDGGLVPIGRRAIRTLVPVDRQATVRQRLAELQLARGRPVLPLVEPLLGSRLGGERIAAAFAAAGQEALGGNPALATRLFAEANRAGKPITELGARWAEAAALAGDLDTALRTADQVVASGGPARADAARVAAAALAHGGQLARAAELFRWSGTAQARVFCALALLGTGAPRPAAELLGETGSSTADEPPTLLAGAAALMAGGVREALTGTPTEALSSLVRATSLLEPVPATVLLPDTPAALAALVAVQLGELTVAESVLARATGAKLGGAPFAIRHRLLQAWVQMLRGNLAAVGKVLASCGGAGSLSQRDWLFAVALEVGVARRASDLGALRRIWAHAAEAVIRHQVDLFTLLPLGEFVVAAARLGDQDRLAAHLDSANALLGGCGNPPLWTTSLHWSQVHAAIIAERPEIAEEHIDALAACAGYGRYHATIADAARSWRSVLGGKVDPDEVAAVARRLHEAGLCWDAARLAGQAAIRTPDRAAMVALLECARQLRGKGELPGDGAVVEAGGDAPGGQRLSERERQVAKLVLEGLTYRQVGDRLFISAKTVEHHMARMRQRLGCANRGELLARLRELLPDQPMP